MGKINNTQNVGTEQAQALVNAREQAIAEMDKLTKIDFSSGCNIDVADMGKAGIKPTYSMTYTEQDKDGNDIVSKTVITDPETVADLVRLDKLTQAGKTVGIGTCYVLSRLAEKKDLLHVKNIAEFGKRYGFKATTTTQYARVGKYFTTMTETENGTHYDVRPECYGAKLANLVQVLSLIDEDLDDPCEKVWTAIADNKLHLDGTLARVKQEMQALAGKAIEKKDENKSAGAGKDENKSRRNISDVLSELLQAVESLDESRQAQAVECIRTLEQIFNGEQAEQATENENE